MDISWGIIHLTHKRENMNKMIFTTKGEDMEKDKDYTLWIPSCWYEDNTLTEYQKEKEMCDIRFIDKLLAVLVRREIFNRVCNREVFSAYDITRKIRKDVGPLYEVKHSDVRCLVSEWYNGTENKNDVEWCRTLINLSNGKTTYVYHDIITLAEDYPGFVSLAITSKKEEESMKTTVLMSEVEESAKRKLDRRIQKGVAFSAFDITRRLREKFDDPKIPHSIARDIVAEWFNGSDWIRTLVNLDTGKTTWVYHKVAVNPTSYPGVVRVVDTEVEDESSCCGSCCDEKISNADYDKLLMDATDLRDMVMEFIEGEATLMDLKGAAEDFDDMVKS